MDDIPANTPVLVGIGIIGQKLEDWRQAREPVDLMIDAATAAVGDAGAPQLAGEIERIFVPRGLWHYPDPARLVAEALGADSATSVLVEIGVLQQTALGEACRLIAEGEHEVTLVVGGEARYRHLRAQIAGEEAPERTQEGEPDITLALPKGVSAELYLEAELNAGLSYMPVNYYAIMESAFRASRGWSVEEHRDYMAGLYSRFSDIAADNPHAWKPGHVDASTIRDPGPKNPMLAFPYTKLHNTSWNVDQASALLFCSAAKAAALGIPREQWVFPLASAECNQVLSVAQRRELHRTPGVAAAARAMFASGGPGADGELRCGDGAGPGAGPHGHRRHALCRRPAQQLCVAGHLPHGGTAAGAARRHRAGHRRVGTADQAGAGSVVYRAGPERVSFHRRHQRGGRRQPAAGGGGGLRG
jgi:acetyl-CoA C-acetyltransferase